MDHMSSFEKEILSACNANGFDVAVLNCCIQKGANLNDYQYDDPYESLLSRCIDSMLCDVSACSQYECSEYWTCAICPAAQRDNIAEETNLIQLVDFFVQHGFDLRAHDGKVASEILIYLVYRTYTQKMVDYIRDFLNQAQPEKNNGYLEAIENHIYDLDHVYWDHEHPLTIGEAEFKACEEVEKMLEAYVQS